ncbi:MAG: triose-phosphate isomerase [Ginsengibacter sp.]
MRKQIAAANWKMNLLYYEAKDLLNKLKEFKVENENAEVILGVPFPYLLLANEIIKNKNSFYVAAQNCSNHSSGAYTGEVSTAMLNSCGINYVIIGHSERRELYCEDNKVIAEKIDAALTNNVRPIFCCGEPLSVRQKNEENQYVEKQLSEGLFHLPAEKLQNFIIAYEPIWAIGTGKTASAVEAQSMHAYIRNVMAKKYGVGVADSISILYGGSVKGANAKEIFGQKDVDGGLVGGASLNASEFEMIIHSLK